MKLFICMRRVGCVAGLTIFAACNQDAPSGISVREQLAESSGAHRATASQPGPATSAAPAVRAVASVNKVAIDRRELVDLLMRTHGLDLLQQLMLREAAAQAGKARGLNISSDDINNEYELTLQADHLDGKEPEKLTPARREQLISEWTSSRGTTREELQIAMERQAWLRKQVEGRIEVTDEMLKKQFDREHGEKVEVRHLQLAAPRFFPQIKARLDKGEPFENLVQEFSQNSLSRSRGGLLPPFSANDDTVPEVFAKAAFSISTGEYTNPIESSGSYHIIRLERRIPPDKVTYEQARDSVRRHVFMRLTMQAMQDLGTRLLMQAELRIEDPALREQYRAAQSSGKLTGPILVGQ